MAACNLPRDMVLKKESEEYQMETKLVSIKTAAKLFQFPQAKLYQLVQDKEVPYIELQNLSGTTQKKINTKTFAEWLDNLAKNNQTI